MEFVDFILAHDGDDLGALALARDRYAGEVEDFDLALTTLEVRRKLRTKVPEWYAVPGLRYPLRLSGEQCSSAETARYKALVAAMAVAEPLAVADLTGGLGVDSWAFAQVATEVLYNEMRPDLADAARANFAVLGVKNIAVRNSALVPSSLVPASEPESPAASVSQILGDFRPDVIFLDPARRASDGRKVFRLEDCQPAVLSLLPELFAACPRLLLKLSPMADISLVCKQLGSVKEVHVVAADGECKELLLLLERDYVGPYSLTIYENGEAMNVSGDSEGYQAPAGARPYPGLCASKVMEGEKAAGDNRGQRPLKGATLGHVRGRGPQAEGAVGGAGAKRRRFGHVSLPPASECLFEPGKALLKAGAFELPCQYGLDKLGRHTHLYVGPEVPEELKPFGKCFRIIEMAPLNKRNIKDIGTRYPSASVTARNIPLTSDQLRAKLHVADGASVHIFGVQVDALNAHYLLVCITA